MPKNTDKLNNNVDVLHIARTLDSSLTSDTMLSTMDNPYSPFTQFDDWYAFDELNGYHSCAYLARVIESLRSLEDDIFEVDSQIAIDQIVSLNLTGNYIKVTSDMFKSPAVELQGT